MLFAEISKSPQLKSFCDFMSIIIGYFSYLFDSVLFFPKPGKSLNYKGLELSCLFSFYFC